MVVVQREGQRLTSDAFLYWSLLDSSETGSLTEPGARQLDWQAGELQCWEHRCAQPGLPCPHQVLARDLNPDPHTFSASTFYTEPFPLGALYGRVSTSEK